MAAIEVLQALQSQVGPRRAGTSGERRAWEWIQARCDALGLPAELDQFTFIGGELYRPLLQLVNATLIAASLALSFSGRPALGSALLAALLLYSTTIHKRLDVRLARDRSHNVIAGLHRPFSSYLADPDKGPAVLLCAHYDTPRAQPGWAARVRRLLRLIGPLALLGIGLYVVYLLLLGLGGLLELAGIGAISYWMSHLKPWVGWLVLLMSAPVLALMALGSVSALVRRRIDSPGADDNGSGTALVMEVARRLKDAPPTHVEPFFAWWGAEETGLFGSRQFVRRFHGQLDRERFHSINADCVGAGELLTIHMGQGVFRRRRTEPAVVERIERIARQLEVRTVRTWESIISGGSSDHAEWVDRGYRNAISLVRANPQPLSLPARILAALLRIPYPNQMELNHIHTAEDTLECVKPNVLAETTDVAEAYVRALGVL